MIASPYVNVTSMSTVWQVAHRPAFLLLYKMGLYKKSSLLQELIVVIGCEPYMDSAMSGFCLFLLLFAIREKTVQRILESSIQMSALFLGLDKTNTDAWLYFPDNSIAAVKLANDAVGKEADAHDHEVAVSFRKGQGKVGAITVVMQEQADKRFSCQDEEKHPDAAEKKRQFDHHAENILFSLIVSSSCVLIPEKPGRRDRAEDAQVIDRYEGVRDSYSGKGFCPQVSYGDVVHKADRVGNHVLDHNGYGNTEYRLIEIFCTDQFH